MANCTRYSGLGSVFAPMSSRMQGVGEAGQIVPRAGRSRPRMRPRAKSAAAITAPELPAEAKASALPSFTSRAPTSMEFSFFCLTAMVCSVMLTTSGAWTTVMGRLPTLWRASSARTTSSGPTRMISSP